MYPLIFALIILKYFPRIISTTIINNNNLNIFISLVDCRLYSFTNIFFSIIYWY
ncbi:putative membrane protein [Bacteroides fragilis str. 3986 N(B)19]|nr:putative membrane protein [Bacteroides fragilis str. 3986 N(B)19]